MIYLYESLCVLVVWMLTQTTAMNIHQDMLLGSGNSGSSGGAGGGDGGAGGGDGGGPPTPPQCSDLSGYTLYNDVKWIKYTTETMDYASCKTLCDRDDARMTVVKTAADAAAVDAMYAAHSIDSVFIGLLQTSGTNFVWSDNTTMTITSSSDNTITDPTTGITAIWYSSKAWDSNSSYRSSPDDCFVMQKDGSGDGKWKDVRCSARYKCSCECKY